MSYNGKSVNGMTVQEVAEALSLTPNPCRLKLSRHEITGSNRRDLSQRPMSVDGDSLFQQQKNNKNSSNAFSVCHYFFVYHYQFSSFDAHREHGRMKVSQKLYHRNVYYPMRVFFHTHLIIQRHVISKVLSFL